MPLRTILASLLVLIFGGAANGSIAYHEVTPVNTTGLTGGSSPWTERSPFASGGTVWQTFSTSANELATTITGLVPGDTYEVSIFIWDASGINGSGDWSVSSSFTSGFGFVKYAPNDANSAQAYNVNLSTGITGLSYTGTFPSLQTGLDPSGPDEGNRDLWVSTMGTTTASGAGEIVVYSRFDSGDRAWLDGVGVESAVPPTAPTDISLSSVTIVGSAPIGTLVGTLTTTDPTPGDSFTYTFVGGAGSTDNGQFIINGNRLETDRDLSALPSPLSVRIRSTDLDSTWVEKSFSIALIDDSDLDGLSDNWELIYFLDLTVATGGGNNDGDLLINSEEESRGTDPTLADTDGDGLNDDLEDNSGVFNGPGDPGSNPLLPDTDGDGLSDADEISSANGSITDPNKRDTDGDGYPDPLEINEGTDPNLDTDHPSTSLPLLINEIVTRNDTGINDGFGKREDWIEIYNPNPTPIALAGYYLTDTAAILTKWTFPTMSIGAGEYMLVFASGNDTIDSNSEAHANFKLSSGGEYFAIVRPNGTTIDDSFSPAFPKQFSDISYGVVPGTGNLRFFDVPTPRAANSGAAYPGVVDDTSFSVDRGFFSTPFSLSITSDTPSAIIRYTLDGSLPSSTHGTIFSLASPISITTTTTVRAIAYRPGWLPTNVDTHTYIFTADVALQPSNPPGWPLSWGGSVPSDYEMDPRVVNDVLGLGVHTIDDALKDIPTVSIVMDQDDFTDPGIGIYTNPLSRWERVCSMEYILPDGSPGFQENCKIEVHGNSSRNPSRMQKHSLRVTFSSSVGIPKLRYPLFPESSVDEFNKLVLRACFTDSWALASWSSTRYRPNDSMYMRDVWMKDSLGAMGQPSSHGNFVQLYVNGLYFGLHNLTERLEDDWFADHIGGEREDWLINEDLSSPPSRWNSMMSILNGNIADNTVYESSKDYIDVDNYIDYMLLHYFADSEDWPHHNGYAAANINSSDGRFRFFVWDQEIALDKFSWNRYSSGSGGGAPFQRFRINEEFKIRFADRTQKHLFNGGALSESEAISRFLTICGGIDKAIVAESARWGDVQATTPYGDTAGSSTDMDADYFPPTLNSPIYFTREQHWVVERDNVTSHYIPTLHDPNDSRSTINELRSNNLFPSIDAPTFSQHGGVLSGGLLDITAPAGTIYYTLDGSDPRLIGGALNPNAFIGASTLILTQTGPVRTRALNAGEWSAINEADFIVGIAAFAGNLVVSELNYNPPGAGDPTEFIELMNIDPVNTIDLSGVSLTGATYTFPSGFLLGPLERVVIVKNQTAFAAAYNTAGMTIAPGQYDPTSLSNGGEELAIISEDGFTDIKRFSYDNNHPWPESADGGGYTLILIDPRGNPNHALSSSWRASVALDGNPGASDSGTPPLDPDADDDQDGLTALLEHALGTSDGIPNSGASLTTAIGLFDDGLGTMREYFTITFQRNLAADDIIYEVQVSEDLTPASWQSGPGFTVFVSSTNNGDGTAQVTYRGEIPIESTDLQFMRLLVLSR